MVRMTIIVMMLRFYILISAVFLSSSAFAQSVDGQSSNNAPANNNAGDNTLLQEQAAICASYARLMEYSGLLEKTQGELWRERRFFAGAMLRSTIASSTKAQPTNAEIDGIINEYSSWMIDLFTANSVQDDKTKLEEKDKLKDYVESFCTGLFNNADKAIVKVRPELFIGTKPDNPDAKTIPMATQEQANELLQENIKLQQALKTLQDQLASQDKALKLAEAKAEIAEQMIETGTPAKPVADNATKTAAIPVIDDNDTLPAPPVKPPLPRDLTAEDDEIITAKPTLDPDQVGLTQIQLASYSTIKNAENGLNILSKELPDEFDVDLQVKAARLASGKNVFRVVSSAMPINTAKDICSYFWSQQYACIIKMKPGS